MHHIPHAEELLDEPSNNGGSRSTDPDGSSFPEQLRAPLRTSTATPAVAQTRTSGGARSASATTHGTYPLATESSVGAVPTHVAASTSTTDAHETKSKDCELSQEEVQWVEKEFNEEFNRGSHDQDAFLSKLKGKLADDIEKGKKSEDEDHSPWIDKMLKFYNELESRATGGESEKQE
ncbi:uncharacterized protein KY384_002849 [Bacidia gigantensis]|uniref:uncharacterized protein n=1 Tax=Bacidia gigantensis TaxID=2732470 RepID=UPI001D03F178|nr:uncharacterized protein KY384_002849 [Bacidia gigantensis]KAG8532364.1 hypothetical protein KY384_002849 [Bacidia gigantensis]